MKLVKSFRSLVFAIAFSVLGISALSLLKVEVKSAEASENIVAVGNNSYALNNWTNAPRKGQVGYSYTYVSGGLDVPLIFTQVLNPSDPEQQWNRWKLNNGYYMLQNKANGLCATIRNVMDRGEISMEGCETNRSDQYLSGGFFNYPSGDIRTVRRATDGSEKCFDMNQFSNNTPFNVFRCSGGSNQNFLHADDNTGLQWGPGQGPQAVQTRTIQSSRYEAWLVGRNYRGDYPQVGNLGHGFIAVIQFQTLTQQRLNGMIWQDVSTQITGVTSINTISRWPNFISGNNYNNSSDTEDTRQIINNGRVADGSVFAVRKAWISSSLSDRIFSNLKNGTGCSEQYGAPCVCTEFSRRLWGSITGETLNLSVFPNQAVYQINYANNANGDFAGGGQLFN